MIEQSHVSTKHITGFGHIIFMWANVETYMHLSLAALTKSPLQRSLLMTWHMTYNNKRDRLRALVDYIELDDKPQKEFDCLIVRLNSAYKMRNTIAHSIWTKGDKPNSIKPQIMVARGPIKLSGFNLNVESYTPNDLVEEASKIQRLGLDFVAFSKARLDLPDDLDVISE